MMAIQLNNNKTAFVDDDDYSYLSVYKWSAWRHRNTWYAVRDQTHGQGARLRVYMHRVILNAAVGLLVDHRDGNGLNNVRSNLRIATNSQNLHNRGAQKNNTSGFKGVSFDKARNKWQARVSVDGRIINLGRFNTPEEAYAICCAAREKHHTASLRDTNEHLHSGSRASAPVPRGDVRRSKAGGRHSMTTPVWLAHITRPIRSDEDHRAALAEIDRLWPIADPGSPEYDRLDLLGVLVDSYERTRWPIGKPADDTTQRVIAALKDVPGVAEIRVGKPSYYVVADNILGESVTPIVNAVEGLGDVECYCVGPDYPFEEAEDRTEVIWRRGAK